MFPFAWVKRKHKLNAIYETLLRNQELTVALQDQVAALTTEVAAVRAGLTTLAEAVDAEQAQVAAALELLTATSPPRLRRCRKASLVSQRSRPMSRPRSRMHRPPSPRRSAARRVGKQGARHVRRGEA
jgi:hypothetical protein